MDSKMIKPIYELNGQVIDILKKARNLISDDPQKASDMLDVSIKAISNINVDLSVKSEVQRIIDTTTED